MTLKDYLELKNQTSVFKAELTNVSGVISFSNSGKRGVVKSFSLGLNSFQEILENILMNIAKFERIKDYDETPWRDLGNQYFTDGPANAMSTVQTKPLFSTISKIITWANYPVLEHCNTDQFCPIEREYLFTAIESIKLLKANFTPKSLYRHLELDSLKDIVSSFSEFIRESNLIFNDSLIERLISSLLTKPFVILTGLSGSGKTKLAQAFAMWLCGSEEQYKIVPVGADWTNREPLLGFPNALEHGAYVKPDSGVLDLIIRATQNENKPYFLILDEMNLSHVERYFADFLSTMESGEEILLHAGEENWGDVPAKISLPKNLFIVGTVNIDETTYMFSPKVLDRANVIEFRVTEKEMEGYLQNYQPLNMDALTAKGAIMATDFVQKAADKSLATSDNELINKTLLAFFTELKKSGAEFGYRSASEILRFAAVAANIEPNWKTEEIIDAAIMQKLLPKVHGSRNKLSKILPVLGGFCLKNAEKVKEVYFEDKEKTEFETDDNVIYKLSFEKICRMYRNAIENGYASYAEA